MKTRYDSILDAWAEVGDLGSPPHIQPKETRARQLEDELAALFKGPLEQYNDGLISATELLGKLADVAFQEV